MAMAEPIHEVQTERRFSRRYQSPDGAFLVKNAESGVTIGDLLDVSASGLSFVYATDVDAIEESSRLSVVSVSGEVHLKAVPYHNRNDFDYIRSYPFEAYRMRRRGVCFAELSEPNKDALVALINTINQKQLR
jgi:hypothetical protein